MKEYKVGIFRVLKNILIGVVFVGIIGVIASIFFDNLLLVAAITAAVGLLYIYTVFISAGIYIRINGNDLYIRQGKKEHNFKIDEVSIRAKSGNDDTADLYIYSNNEEEYIDCSLLGHAKYYELLEELGVVGEKQAAIKLETKKTDKKERK